MVIKLPYFGLKILKKTLSDDRVKGGNRRDKQPNCTF
jgi:hypothetical protein